MVPMWPQGGERDTDGGPSTETRQPERVLEVTGPQKDQGHLQVAVMPNRSQWWQVTEDSHRAPEAVTG